MSEPKDRLATIDELVDKASLERRGEIETGTLPKPKAPGPTLQERLEKPEKPPQKPGKILSE